MITTDNPKESQMGKIIREVCEERKRQEEKWGEQNHEPSIYLMILGEEVGEANKAALESRFGLAPLGHYREELIQVAAVAIAMIESYDRNKWDYPDTTVTPHN